MPLQVVSKMDFLQEFKTSVGDSFVTLPLILMGFTFFLGTLTSNIGMLYLFIGQMVLVPMLSYLTNTKAEPIWGNPISFVASAKWFLSVFTFLTVHTMALKNPAIYSSWIYIVIGQLVTFALDKDLSVFFLLNPISWFFPPTPVTPAAQCSIVPGSPIKDIGTNPSTWLTHILFFFGFVFANAGAIYNEPTPVLQNTQSVDSVTLQTRQANLSARVANRKWKAVMIILASIVVLVFLLVFRFSMECETSFIHSLIPMILITLTGASWFTLIYTYCGVQPSDMLGIVQGMISPDLIDNPIVCVDTASKDQ
jgi:hypothetical protein